MITTYIYIQLFEFTFIREMLKPNDAIAFEPKYIYVLLSCVLITLWRVEQSITIAKPFIDKYRRENDGNDPSIDQLRTKLKDLPFHDFVYDFCYESLHELQNVAGQALSSMFSPNRAAAVMRLAARQPSSGQGDQRSQPTQADLQMERKLEDRIRSGKAWPVKNLRRKAFSESPLSDLRLYRSCHFAHESCLLPLDDDSKQRRLSCALCSSNDCQQKTAYECKTCKIPLCIHPIESDEQSCIAL